MNYARSVSINKDDVSLPSSKLRSIQIREKMDVDASADARHAGMVWARAENREVSNEKEEEEEEERERERRGIHPEDGARKRGKMHTLEHIGRWFVRPARMMLSRGSGQAPEKPSLIVAVVRGLELAHSPRDRGLGARGARGGTGGVSHGPSAYHRARKSSKCILFLSFLPVHLLLPFFLAAPFSFFLSFFLLLLSVKSILFSTFLSLRTSSPPNSLCVSSFVSKNLTRGN